MNVYIPSVVRDIRECLGNTLNYKECRNIKEYVERIGDAVWRAVENNDQRTHHFINNYHPSFLSWSWADIVNANFTRDQALDSSAFYFSYAGLDDVPNEPINGTFESAIDLLLSGDLPRFQALIDEEPNLLNERSQYGHGALMWHYLASNGVEMHRQVVPHNLSEMISWFIDRDIDIVHTTMQIYGGHHTMIDLLTTSAHPKDAGLLDQTVKRYRELT